MYQPPHPHMTRKQIDHYSYILSDEIGRGFSSRVYKGKDDRTQELVAVKVIDMKMIKQSIHAQLLKNEINALRTLSCKHIMKLHDVFQTQNNTYIITEFCDSGDLSNYIRKRGLLQEIEAIRILQSVLQALLEMNKKGFIHRDIKPANILIHNSIPKLADFGFAIPAQEARLQGKNFNVGTPLYMSPQALRQQGHTEQGDVWAIGIVFYEMLFGRVPYNGQSEAALISNILNQQLRIPNHPQISNLAKDFIKQCLQIDDNRRMRIRDMANHQIFKANNIQQPSQQQIRQAITPPPVEQRVKRSLSQGGKNELKSKDYIIRQQQQQQQNILQPINNNIQKSTSQQRVQRHQFKQKTQPNEEFKHKMINSECKNNNDILFSQVNFCRFLYKFAQIILSSKTIQCETKDKIIFIIAKTIAIKITKLYSLTDKENNLQNLFQLEDLQEYKKTESCNKFIQAISEYNDKYTRFFDRTLKLCQQKNELTKDTTFICLLNQDLTETETFYRISQQYIKQCLSDLKAYFISCNQQNINLDNQLSEELQQPGYIFQNLCYYYDLIQKSIEYQKDYKTFAKITDLNQDKKTNTVITYGMLEQLMVRIL